MATTLAGEVGRNCIALWDFTFRAGTSGLQDSPALAMAEWPGPASADLMVQTASMGAEVLADTRNGLDSEGPVSRGFVYSRPGTSAFGTRIIEVAA